MYVAVAAAFKDGAVICRMSCPLLATRKPSVEARWPL